MAIEPLAVRCKAAFSAIGVGTTRGYELINAGELETYKHGRARFITTASLKAFIERQIAAQAKQREAA